MPQLPVIPHSNKISQKDIIWCKHKHTSNSTSTRRNRGLLLPNNSWTRPRSTGQELFKHLGRVALKETFLRLHRVEREADLAAVLWKKKPIQIKCTNLEAIVLYGKQPRNDSRAEFTAEWEKKTPCFSAISGEISYFPLQQYCFCLVYRQHQRAFMQSDWQFYPVTILALNFGLRI